MSYYIYYNNVRYFLDATTDISVTRQGRLTSHPTADKKTRSDNYVKDNPTATYSGVITDIITPSSLKQMSTGEYINALEQAMDSQSAVGFRYRLDGQEESDWFITSLKTSQNRTHGYGGTTPANQVVQSFNIDITLEKAVFTDIVQVEFNVPQSFKDALGDKTTSSSLPTEKTGDGDENTPGSILAARAAGEAQESARFYRGEGVYNNLQ